MNILEEFDNEIVIKIREEIVDFSTNIDGEFSGDIVEYDSFYFYKENSLREIINERFIYSNNNNIRRVFGYLKPSSIVKIGNNILIIKYQKTNDIEEERNQ